MGHRIEKNMHIKWLSFLFTIIVSYLINILGYHDISSIFFFVTLFFLILDLSNMEPFLK